MHRLATMLTHPHRGTDGRTVILREVGSY